jgi:class 3 adenylate cyclase
MVMVGNIGAASRMNFGMVGNTVNLAHRLVDLAKHGETIVSQAVVDSMPDEPEGWTFKHLPRTPVKGKGDPVRLYLAHA